MILRLRLRALKNVLGRSRLKISDLLLDIMMSSIGYHIVMDKVKEDEK